MCEVGSNAHISYFIFYTIYIDWIYDCKYTDTLSFKLTYKNRHSYQNLQNVPLSLVKSYRCYYLSFCHKNVSILSLLHMFKYTLD